MNLIKIDTALCFAFQQSEGPFKICIQYNNKKEWKQYSRSEIKDLSNLTEIISISLAPLSDERRSDLSLYLRGDSDNRRKNERFDNEKM